MKNTMLSLGLLLLLPGVCLGQEYQVSGGDLAGRATITGPKWGAVRVSADLQIQSGKAAKPLAIRNVTGARFFAGNVLFQFTTTEIQKTGLVKGFTGWLENPGFSTRAWQDKKITKTHSVSLKRNRNGQLVGTIDGRTTTWTPAGNTKDLVVLAIPGLSTNNWNRVGIPYLDENLRALKARGLEARRLKIKTEASVRTNAAFIAREIRKEAARGKRVIVLAHSKGATDTTAALALYPDLIAMTAGLIAVQPVFGGSPIADLVSKSSFLSGAVRITFERIFKGEKEAVSDLTRAARQAFLKAHPYPAAKVPTVVIRSSFNRKVSKSVLWANQKLIMRLEQKHSDGMVVLEDALIPGAVKTITLQDLDHFEPGVRVESPHSPTKVTNLGLDALLLALQRKPAPKQQQGRVVDGRLGN